VNLASEDEDEDEDDEEEEEPLRPGVHGKALRRA